jgi:glycosyltransferase involved in cell wall biosynthesis
MNVLFLSIDLFSIGGIQRYSRYVLRALDAAPRVAQVTRASFTPPAPAGFEAIPVDLVGRRGFAGKLLFVLGVLRLARARRSDLLICDHVNLAPIALACRLLLRTPYVVNVYAIEVWGELSFLRRRALLDATHVISDCEFTRRHLEARYPALRGRISVVPDGVDVERFTPAETQAAETFNVLTVSRLAIGRSKGHDAIMRAFASIRDQYPRVRYLIAGAGDDRPRLEALAGDLGIEGAVTFLGRIEEDELPALYRSCDVFALVSSFSMAPPQGEGVPLAVLEAQASGKPVITSNADGSTESIVDGATGYLVDPGDHAAIAAHLVALLEDRDLRSRMGAAARKLAERRFSYAAFEARTLAVLDALPLARPAQTTPANEAAR